MNSKLKFKGKRENYEENFLAGNIHFIGGHYFYGFSEDYDIPLSGLNKDKMQIILGEKRENSLNYLKFNHRDERSFLEFYDLVEKTKNNYKGFWMNLNLSVEDFIYQHELNHFREGNLGEPICFSAYFTRNISKINNSMIEKILGTLPNIKGDQSNVTLKLLNNLYEIFGTQNQQLELGLDFEEKFPEDDLPF